MHCPENEINPDSYYENDTKDYDVFWCVHCNENHSMNIYFDHLSNGNICEACLNHEEFPSSMGMDSNMYERYKSRVLKQLPSNPL
jgi:hypothetical protein